MPELPEVETVRRGLEPVLMGARIEKVTLTRPDLRFAFPKRFAQKLEGETIISVGRRAKYLLFALESGQTWLSHLGMTGNFGFTDGTIAQPSRLNQPEAKTHRHVFADLVRPDGQTTTLIYSDPRRFGFMDLFIDSAACPYLSHLGPEPLGNEMSADFLAARFAGRRQPIKSALLDQRNIAGLGNIYVCEALWRAGIHPKTPVAQLIDGSGDAKPALLALMGHIREVLNAAIAAGGSTLRDFRSSDGQSGYFQHNFDVYDRAGEPCRSPGCDGIVTRIVQSGRSSFLCPVCQPESS